MTTPEFKSAISGGNLLRARIMLKDSLVVDPTFRQFNEMLAWAQTTAPELIVPHDGEPLEDNSSKWSLELMNLELSQLVGNFSKIRIEHLQKVISIVMKKEIERLQAKQIASDAEKREKRQDTLKTVRDNGEKIQQILNETKKPGKRWERKHIDQMKRAAQNIIKAIEEYERNK